MAIAAGSWQASAAAPSCSACRLRCWCCWPSRCAGAALLVASLTPLSLTDPVATFRFDDPLVNYRHLLEDKRFLDSISVQLKLSASSVALQLGVGLGLALLLNGKSKVLGATRTVFLIPMVLPPIVVALIWKILYTPDVSPLHRALEAVGLPVRSLIANPDTALWAIWRWRTPGSGFRSPC
jgi:multiple sugar transport system permease protein